jgi:hypothetical protein
MYGIKMIIDKKKHIPRFKDQLIHIKPFKAQW